MEPVWSSLPAGRSTTLTRAGCLTARSLHFQRAANGRIIFNSERCGGYLRCGRVCPTYTLHDMASDGSDIRRLSFHETHEWHPSVSIRRQEHTYYLTKLKAPAMSSAIILRLLFSMKKLGPACK